MIQEWLSARAEHRIQREFDWEHYEDGEHTALFAADAPEFLAERGLGWMTDDFIDLERLNSLGEEPLGNGHFSCVHQIDDTDIVAKRYYPLVYSGGHNGDNRLRQVTESSILRDLIVNLALENALADDDTFITPRYLGHLMLKSDTERANRHYTLMSKLDIIDHDEFNDLPQADKEQDRELRDRFKDHCTAALRGSDSRVMLVNFDIDKHNCNMPPLRDPETGDMRIGVIDADTYIKWRKRVEGNPVSYLYTDPSAPWLSVDKYGFDAKTTSQALAG